MAGRKAVGKLPTRTGRHAYRSHLRATEVGMDAEAEGHVGVAGVLDLGRHLERAVAKPVRNVGTKRKRELAEDLVGIVRGYDSRPDPRAVGVGRAGLDDLPDLVAHHAVSRGIDRVR